MGNVLLSSRDVVLSASKDIEKVELDKTKHILTKSTINCCFVRTNAAIINMQTMLNFFI